MLIEDALQPRSGLTDTSLRTRRISVSLAVVQLDVRALPDRELAERVRDGDEHAFELVMRRNNRLLYRTARAILRDDADAEDCVQEAYPQGFRSIAA